uniref:Uncharacterized protein n=1 Tax=Anguilla anguilla TaxID=7936 RepID=A0A0E9RGK7_ANGAN
MLHLTYVLLVSRSAVSNGVLTVRTNAVLYLTLILVSINAASNHVYTVNINAGSSHVPAVSINSVFNHVLAVS